MIFYFSSIMTRYEWDFPFEHEVSLVVCLMLISRSVDVATFLIKVFGVFPFLSGYSASLLFGNQQSFE